MAEKKRNRTAPSEHELNLEELQKLIDMLAARDVTEFEMERNGLRLRFRRDRAGSNSLVVADASSGVGHQELLATSPAIPMGGPVSTPAAAPSAPAAEPAGAIAD